MPIHRWRNSKIGGRKPAALTGIGLLGCVVAVIGSVLAWLIYASEKPSLVHYLQTVGFGDEDMAKQIAAFSVGQAGWFIFFFALAAGLLVLLLPGFSPENAQNLAACCSACCSWWIWAGPTCLISFIGITNKNMPRNPIIDFLRDKPYEHRVAGLPFRRRNAIFPVLRSFIALNGRNIIFLITTSSRWTLSSGPACRRTRRLMRWHWPPRSADTYYLMARRWQLTNTRYLLGPAGFLDVLNEQLDPLQHRFRIVQRFNIRPKPGVEEFHHRLEELTAVPE